MPQPKKLKNMTIESVDLCKRGANPFADIKLTKSIDEEETFMDTQFDTLSKAMDESNRSILADTRLSADERADRLRKNAEEYAECRALITKARADAAESEDEEPDPESADAEKSQPAPNPDSVPTGNTCKPAKKALDPEVRKALDEVQTLRKQLELTQLRGIAARYEALGKSVDELTDKLYDMKKSGAYDDYVALLDELLVTQEQAGVFKEYGSGKAGVGKSLDAALAEVRKAFPTLNQYEQMLKAYELNPDMPEM